MASIRDLAAAAAAVVVLAAPASAAVAPRGTPDSFADLAERLSPAVVNISSAQKVKGQGAGADPQLQKKFSPQAVSLGSGFIVDPKGIVITNNHVIDNADDITVTLNDGRELKATIRAVDRETDIAVLQLDAPPAKLPFVTFGDSNTARVGDWVLAIGNPFGLGGSVSVGIISAKSRDINSGLYDDYLQTDAAINKGNSGGPLFNMAGDVIGVNTAIISPTGGSIGIGFAVPSDTVSMVVDQLKQFGVTRRGWLGVKISTVADDVAVALDIPENAGAVISAVTPGSPAATAGFEAGDVILKFDGKAVTTMRGLPKIVAQTTIGRSVDVEVVRNGARLTKQVAVGLLEEDEDPSTLITNNDNAPPQAALPDDKSSAPVMGLTLSRLTRDVRRKFQFDDKVKGVVVEAVDPASPAAQKGIKIGDIIVEAGQDQVAGPDDVARSVDKVKKSGRKAVLLRVEDGKGDLRFVAVPLS